VKKVADIGSGVAKIKQAVSLLTVSDTAVTVWKIVTGN